jgi:hypothetical protein
VLTCASGRCCLPPATRHNRPAYRRSRAVYRAVRAVNRRRPVDPCPGRYTVVAGRLTGSGEWLGGAAGRTAAGGWRTAQERRVAVCLSRGWGSRGTAQRIFCPPPVLGRNRSVMGRRFFSFFDLTSNLCKIYLTNEYLENFHTLTSVARSSIFRHFLRFFYFLIQIQNFELDRYRTGWNRCRSVPPVPAVSGPVPAGSVNPACEPTLSAGGASAS